MKSFIAVSVLALFPGTVMAQNKNPEIRIGELEHRIHDRINDARKANGRGLLQLNEKLSDVARTHSEDMAKAGYFSHTDPAGRSASQRVERAGIACRVTGENLFQANLYTRVRIAN